MLFWLIIRSVLHPGAASLCARWRSFAILPLPGRTSPACRQKHPHPVNVVHQVAQTDLCSGSGYADRAQQQIPRSLRLHAKNMLDPRTDLGSGLVAFQFSGRQWTIAAPFALDVFAKTVLREPLQSFRRAVGRIRPDILARVVGKELLEHIAVVQGRIRHCIASNQFVLHIHRDVVLVSVKRLAVLLGPAAHPHLFFAACSRTSPQGYRPLLSGRFPPGCSAAWAHPRCWHPRSALSSP